MIEKLLKRLNKVTDKYISITCSFRTNYSRPTKHIYIEWNLYIEDIENKHFDTFEALEKYVIFLYEEMGGKRDIVETSEKLCLEK